MSSDDQGPKVADKDAAGPARRNRYFSGKLLTVADYQLEQRYHIERRWLINRMLHGSGVVSGLEVEQSEPGGWRVSPGMALDAHGRELVVCEALDLLSDADLIWLSGGVPTEPPAEQAGTGSAAYLLRAHYAERWVDGVRIDDDYGEGSCEANRLCETVVFSLTRDDGEAPDQTVAADPCRTARLARLGRLHVDLELGVSLARVTVSFSKSGAAVLAAIDAKYRRPPFVGASAPPPPGNRDQTGPRTGGPLRRDVRVAVAGPAAPEPPPPVEGDPQ